jgi:CheY-like chemotaxis protein
MHILFSDDNLDTRSFYQMAFEIAGHQMVLAHNGQEAVNLAAVGSFDAIVLDMATPVMDGEQALQQIRQLPGYERVPIVIFTAFPVPHRKEALTHAGADMVLHKPMFPHELLGHLDYLVARRAAEAEIEEIS